MESGNYYLESEDDELSDISGFLSDEDSDYKPESSSDSDDDKPGDDAAGGSGQNNTAVDEENNIVVEDRLDGVVAEGDGRKVENKQSKKRKGKDVLGKENWKRTKRQKKVRQGATRETKSGRVIQEKWMGEPGCTAACKFNCEKFTEEERLNLFQLYWNEEDTKTKKAIVLKNVEKLPSQGKRTNYAFYLPHGTHSVKTRVCKPFFLSTLACGEGFLNYTLKHQDENGLPVWNVKGGNRQEVEKVRGVEAFIKQLPVVEPHYVRSSSTRMYIPSAYQSVAELYRHYVEKTGDQVASIQLFRKIFDSFNIGIHAPKKDKCAICSSVDEIPAETISTHQEEKEAIRRYHSERQALEFNQEKRVVSFDLQKVLSTPHCNSMLTGFSRKFAVYNETFYESGSKRVICFVWGEDTARRGSCEVASAFHSYLSECDDAGVKDVEAFCDGCGGQNRNRGVMGMIVSFVQKASNLKRVKITFLLKGHTYMQVDSAHSVIENNVKGIPIWAPSQWAGMIQSAVKDPKKRKYEVVPLTQDMVLDWKGLGELMFPQSKKVRWSDVRQAEANIMFPNALFVKFGMQETGEMVNVARKKGRGATGFVYREPQRLYEEELSISKAKKNDLMALCRQGIIPRMFHAEYSALRCEGDVRDCLDEPDEEEASDSEGS